MRLVEIYELIFFIFSIIKLECNRKITIRDLDFRENNREVRDEATFSIKVVDINCHLLCLVSPLVSVNPAVKPSMLLLVSELQLT